MATARTQIDALTSEIAGHLQRGSLVVWCGAGISVPAGLPIVADLVKAVLGHSALSEEESERVAHAVPSRLPFERLMEVLLEGMDDVARRDFLAVFSAGRPGLHHVFLGRLVKKNLLRAIFTTNFDPHIEKALEVESLVRHRDFEVCADQDTFNEMAWPPTRPRIVKLHGSVEDPDRLGATVARVAAPGAVQRVVGPTRWAFRDGPHAAVLVMGYSFSDRFDLSPAIVGCGGADTRKLVVDLQFEEKDDNSLDVESEPRWGGDVPHPASGFENRWHVYGDWSQVIRRLGQVLDLGELPAHDPDSTWRGILDESFRRLDKKQPGLPSVVLAGQLLVMIGDDAAAVPYLRTASKIAAAGTYEKVHLSTLQVLGGALVRAGDAQGAVQVLKGAEELAEGIDQGRYSDHVQALLGMLHQNLGAGHTTAALQYYDRALTVARGNDSAELSLVPHLEGLAASWMRIGDFDAAEQAHRQALTIVEPSGDLYRTAEVYGNMGTMFYMLRDYDQALLWYEKARSTSKLCGDVEKEGIHVLNMANLFAKQGKYREALELYATARKLLLAVLPEGHHLVKTLAANERVARKRAEEH